MTLGGDVNDTIPGILFRLHVFEADGSRAFGYPKIYNTMSRFRAAIRAQEKNGDPGRTMVKEGCARGPWLNLDGPVIPAVDEFDPAHIGGWPQESQPDCGL